MSRPANMALKTLARALVESVGGLFAAESATRLGKSHLAECYDPAKPSFLPVDVVADLERCAPAPLITRYLAEQAGCVLVPVMPAGPGRLPCRMADFGRECGETFAAYAQAMGDGHVDRAELERLRAELGDVLRVTHAALAETQRALEAAA